MQQKLYPWKLRSSYVQRPLLLVIDFTLDNHVFLKEIKFFSI